jgi:hypothetical protein
MDLALSKASSGLKTRRSSRRILPERGSRWVLLEEGRLYRSAVAAEIVTVDIIGAWWVNGR